MRLRAVLLFFFVVSFHISGKSQSCLPDGITFTTQSQVDSFQLNHPDCSEILGRVRIWSSSVKNLIGLSSVTYIGNGLLIYNNDSLTSLSGLNRIAVIDGGLEISHNQSLVDLFGLTSLKRVGGSVSIGANALKNLKGIYSLTTVEGYLVIWSNAHLNSLEGLVNLTSIQGLDIQNNDKLTTLLGLENLDLSSISHFAIFHNDSLTFCAIQNICKYMTNPVGFVRLHDNTWGCNTPEELNSVCNILTAGEHPQMDQISLFPNPADRWISVSTSNGLPVDEITFYNQLGQGVLKIWPDSPLIDVTGLNHGLYIIEIVSNDRRMRSKIIVR